MLDEKKDDDKMKDLIETNRNKNLDLMMNFSMNKDNIMRNEMVRYIHHRDKVMSNEWNLWLTTILYEFEFHLNDIQWLNQYDQEVW